MSARGDEPYDKILADGVIRVAYYIANDGSDIVKQRAFLRSLNLTETMIDAKPFEMATTALELARLVKGAPPPFDFELMVKLGLLSSEQAAAVLLTTRSG